MGETAQSVVMPIPAARGMAMVGVAKTNAKRRAVTLPMTTRACPVATNPVARSSARGWRIACRKLRASSAAPSRTPAPWPPSVSAVSHPVRVSA